MQYEGVLKKMQTEIGSPIQYYMVFDTDFLNVNQILNKTLKIDFIKHQCLNCGNDAIERVEHNSELLDVCQSCGDANKAVNHDLVQSYNGPTSPGKAVIQTTKFTQKTLLYFTFRSRVLGPWAISGPLRVDPRSGCPMLPTKTEPSRGRGGTAKSG